LNSCCAKIIIIIIIIYNCVMHHTSSSSIYHHQNNIYIKNIHFISPLSSQVKQSNYKKQYTQYNERIQNKRYLKNEKK